MKFKYLIYIFFALGIVALFFSFNSGLPALANVGFAFVLIAVILWTIHFAFWHILFPPPT